MRIAATSPTSLTSLTSLLVALVTLALAGSGRPALAQDSGTGEASPVAVSAICGVTFGEAVASEAVASEVAAADIGPASSADPADAMSDLVGPGAGPTITDTRFDAAVRSCSSVEEWVAVAAAYPGALQGVDPVAFLSARCADPGAGLEAYATCHALALALAEDEDAVGPGAAASPLPGDAGPADATQSESGAPPSSGSQRVALPTMTVEVPSATRVRYFTVVGDTPGALLRQTLRNSRRSCGGKDALACVSLKTKVGQVRTKVDPRTRSCTFASVDITFSATVYVPRWTRPARVPAALVEWWRQELERSALHE